MLASELIESLKKSIEKHGDLETEIEIPTDYMSYRKVVTGSSLDDVNGNNVITIDSSRK